MNSKPLLIAIILAALAVIPAGCGQIAGEAPAPPDKPYVVPPGAVAIKVLPPLLTLRGDAVPFRGRTEITPKLAGSMATEIVLVSFSADGENAHKSAVRITWEDGAVQTIPAGAKNLVFPAQRRAKKIAILGYSFHELRVFKDVPQRGTLSWEIRYAPVE